MVFWMTSSFLHDSDYFLSLIIFWLHGVLEFFFCSILQSNNPRLKKRVLKEIMSMAWLLLEILLTPPIQQSKSNEKGAEGNNEHGLASAWNLAHSWIGNSKEMFAQKTCTGTWVIPHDAVVGRVVGPRNDPAVNLKKYFWDEGVSGFM